MIDKVRFGKDVGSAGKIHAKVFMKKSTDRIHVAAYSEYPDTVGDWDSAFKLPDHVVRLGGIKRALTIDTLRNYDGGKMPLISLANQRENSPLPSSPNPAYTKYSNRDLLALLQLLAVVECQEGSQALHQALHAAAATVQQKYPSAAQLGQARPTPNLGAALVEYIQKSRKIIDESTYSTSEVEPVHTHKDTKGAPKANKNAAEGERVSSKDSNRESVEKALEVSKKIVDELQDFQIRDECLIDVAIARARELATAALPWKAAPQCRHRETVVEL